MAREFTKGSSAPPGRFGLMDEVPVLRPEGLRTGYYPLPLRGSTR